MERSFQPVIVFSFSKRECEAYALQLSKLDFTTGIDVVGIPHCHNGPLPMRHAAATCIVVV